MGPMTSGAITLGQRTGAERRRKWRERGSAGALHGDGGKAASSRRTPKKERRRLRSACMRRREAADSQEAPRRRAPRASDPALPKAKRHRWRRGQGKPLPLRGSERIAHRGRGKNPTLSRRRSGWGTPPRLRESARSRRFAEDAPTKGAEGERFWATKGETAPMVPRAGQALPLRGSARIAHRVAAKTHPLLRRRSGWGTHGKVGEPFLRGKALRMGHAPRNFFEAWLRYNAGIWRIARMRAFGRRIFPKRR
jgi:hypothetical protein